MKGKYFLSLSTLNLNYSVVLDRSITVLRGDSSSGKSEFVDLLSTTLNEINRGESPIADYETNFKNVYVVNYGDSFEKISKEILNLGDGLVVSDENTSFFKNEGKLAELVLNSGCYFLFITRKSLGSLPYSVKSVYSLVTEKKGGKFYSYLERNFVGKIDFDLSVDILLTEDRGSALDFFRENVSCVVDTINSKDNFKTYCRKRGWFKNKNGFEVGNVILLVDGAAYGNKLYDSKEILANLRSSNINVCIACPESFEWLVLNSLNTVSDIGIGCILEKPCEYVDSSKYLSWERYFTSLLNSICKKLYGISYSKKGSYNEDVQKVLKELKCELLEILESSELDIMR